MVTWVFVLAVFGALAFLTTTGDPVGGGGRAASPAAVTSTIQSATPTTTLASGSVLAAEPERKELPKVNANLCEKVEEKRTYLPLHRWTSFDLFAVDNSWILKTKLWVSMIASFFFAIASLIWNALGSFLGFSVEFDMVCSAAAPINSAAGIIGNYVMFFIIPMFLVVLLAAVRRYNQGGQGPAAALRMLAGFVVAAGGVFFVTEQSAAHENNPTAPYTAPYMAVQAQKFFTGMGTSLNAISYSPQMDSWAFYDKAEHAGQVNCIATSQKLYELYDTENAQGAGKNAAAAMMQMSRIWELTFLRSYIAAQYGNGSAEYPAPSHVTCRELEMELQLPKELKGNKQKVFDLATGVTTEPGSSRWNAIEGGFGGNQHRKATMMWSACSRFGGDWKVIPQWEKSKGGDNDDELKDEDPCEDDMEGDRKKGDIAGGNDDDGMWWYNGDDELDDAFKDCRGEEACDATERFVSSFLGDNSVDRLLQGVIALITALIFAFVMGPIAVGLMVISIALAFLVMLVPITLGALAMGSDFGKRMAKLTAASMAAKLLFTLLLSVIGAFIYVTYDAINSALGAPVAPSLFEQLLLAAAPIVALIVLRKLFSMAGMGDISKLTGALGFMGAAALKATGDKTLSNNADTRMSNMFGRIGYGNKRLSNLDRKNLMFAPVNNRATRALGRKASQKGKELAQPLVNTAKDVAADARAKTLGYLHHLKDRAANGTPEQRAQAFTSMAGVAAGAAVLATATGGALGGGILLAGAAGAGALGASGAKGLGRRGVERVNDALRSKLGYLGDAYDPSGDPQEYQPGSLQPFPYTNHSGTAMLAAQQGYKYVAGGATGVERLRRQEERTDSLLDNIRARQHGALADNGVNNSFTGYSTAMEAYAAVQEYAAKSGVAVDDVLNGASGLMAVSPVMKTKGGIPQFPAHWTLEQKSNPIHYLDEQTKRRLIMPDGQEESTDAYVARLYATLAERGFVDKDGRVVDYFASMGLDRRVPADALQIEAILAGTADRKPAVIHRLHDETYAVQAAHARAARYAPAAMRIDLGMADVARDIVTRATSVPELNDFGAAPLVTAKGWEATTAQVRDSIQAKANEIVSLSAKMASFQQAQSAGTLSVPQAEVERLQRAYEEQFRGILSRLDEAAAAIRDQADRAAFSRGEAKITIDVASMDTSAAGDEIARVVKQAERAFTTEVTRRHKELERLLGSISVSPRTEAEAEALKANVAKLEELIENIYSEQDKGNRDLLRRLEEFRAQQEARAARARTNPRRAGGGSRPRSAKDVLRDLKADTDS
ncbi:hypothetical protein [Bailinhaonella thermotolerans]|uniref:Uncharacterized protein n=1 Tax=Bailinhaonella thermotolerans TaxID=1070861 RepID=A0A3A4A5B0_9ACTN|nr:hypothetical protein [Bailinhaonella thermotolerans]RJL24026.1 hypothetical protein D5H75_31870 [Bailinhaonella thermotolerans]